MSSDVGELARRFVDATLSRPGVDVGAIEEILQEVKNVGAGDAFEREVSSLVHGRDRARLLPSGSGNIVPAILRDELSGPALAEAEYLIGLRTSPDHWFSSIQKYTGMSIPFYDGHHFADQLYHGLLDLLRNSK